MSPPTNRFEQQPAHPKPTRAGEKADAVKQRDALKEKIVPEAYALKDVPQLAAHPERLPEGRSHLHDAYIFMMQRYNQSYISPPTTPNKILGRTILSSILDDDNFDRYLPLMTKESALNPESKSPTGALGYFQVTQSALDEINKYFDIGLTAQNLQNPTGNCIAGILYYELLIANNVDDKDEFKGLTPQGKKLVALAMYNAGPGITSDLWKHFKATSYGDFEKKLSVELVLKLGTTQKKSSRTIDPVLHVAFEQVPGLDTYLIALGEKSPKLAHNVTLGTRTISVQKIGEMLRYSRLIEGLEKLPIDTPITAPALAPTPVPLPEAAVIPPMPNGYLNRTETYSVNRKLWSMAEALRVELVKTKYKDISDGSTPGERSNDRDFLLAAIAQFNREYNPQFENVDDQLSNIVLSTSIYIPARAYLDIFNKDFKKESAASQEEVEAEAKIPAHTEFVKAIPLYKDARLTAAGNTILANKAKLNLKKIETYPGLKLPKAKKARTRTDYIVLHSTETNNKSRGAESTAKTHRAHYVVDWEGKIYAARDDRDEFDHAGRFRNPRAKAIWNGDTDVSLHSIGIEVATKPGEEWNENQYAAVNQLVHALGEKYKIPAKNVLTHSQVASSAFGRGRKQDPINVHWEKLDLPNNYLRVDTDVMTGRVAPNFSSIKEDWMANTIQRDHMIEGLLYSVELKTLYKGQLDAVKKESETQWKKEMSAQGVVDYTVKVGDTLWAIARTQKTSVRKIQVLNDLRGNKLTPKTTIKLPKRP